MAIPSSCSGTARLEPQVYAQRRSRQTRDVASMRGTGPRMDACARPRDAGCIGRCTFGSARSSRADTFWPFRSLPACRSEEQACADQRKLAGRRSCKRRRRKIVALGMNFISSAAARLSLNCAACAPKLGFSHTSESAMEHRRLGASGFTVPVLSFGTGTFGGKGELFSAWGNTDVAEARRLVDICLDSGISMFDTADVYSRGASESILGEAIKGRRDKVIVSTKATFRFSDAPNDVGSSRHHLLASVDAQL